MAKIESVTKDATLKIKQKSKSMNKIKLKAVFSNGKIAKATVELDMLWQVLWDKNSEMQLFPGTKLSYARRVPNQRDEKEEGKPNKPYTQIYLEFAHKKGPASVITVRWSDLRNLLKPMKQPVTETATE